MFPKSIFSTIGKKFCLAALLSICVLGSNAFAQLDNEFWFAPPELTQAINPGTDGPRDRPIQLVISTLEKAARVEIIKPADASFETIVENIPANSTRIVNLTPFIDKLESKPENAILNTGLLIKSTQSISAYYEIRSANNTDLFALKGFNAKGKLFYVPFQTRWNNSLRKGPGGAFYNPETYASFDIVATDDSTEVTVTPKKDLVGHPAGVPFTFMLNRGEVYSCRAIDRFGANHPAGSKIESNKDIAVTMKDDMLQFDINEQSAGADIAGDQLIPVEYMGDNYALIKGGLNNNGDRCYILATEDNTIIRFDGSAQAVDTLNEGEQYELVMTKASYYLNTNGKKVAVLHISGLQDQLGGAIIPALTCTGTNRIGFTRTSGSTFIVNIIAKLSTVGKFRLNGDPTLVPASAFTALQGGNGWAFARINFSTAQIPAGTTLVLQNSGNELFHVGVTNYATGVGSNYGYFSNFSRLNLGKQKTVCVGDTAVLDAGPAKTSYLWSTGDTTRFLETLEPGKYWVTTQSGTECPKSDTVKVRFYEPNFDLGPDDTICIGGSKLLTPDGVFTYEWQDGSTATSYLVTKAGIYWAQVADFQGCRTRDSIQIFEFPRPVTPVATGSDTVCRGGSVPLSMNFISNATYAWLDPDSNVISGRQITVNTASQPAGAYKGFIKVKGCESLYDTAFVGVTEGPPINLGNDTVLCITNGTLILDPVNNQPGYTYLWSNGSTDTSLAVTVSGTYTVRVGNAEGCFSFDTISVNFQGPAGAVSLTGPGQFCTNQPAQFGVVEVPGTIYNWTGPDNFSFTGPTVSIPSIQAAQAGIYQVIPFLNGCPGNLAEKVISVIAFPVVDLGPDTSSCSSFSKILDPVNGSSGLSFLWSTGSTDTSIVVSSQGTYTVLVSNASCSASDTVRIEFGIGPDTVVFSGDRVYCSGENASFGVLPVAGESYSWTGPNGFSASGAQVSIPAITAAQAGVYEVTPSLPGCTGTSFTISIQVNSRPFAPGMKDTSFCAGGSVVLDPVPNGNGEVFYLWNNGSADSTLTVSAPGKYSVILDNGLCQSFDTVQVVSSPKPSAPQASSDTAVCPGSSVVLSVQAVSGQTYSWSGPGGFTASGNSVNITNAGSGDFGSYFVLASFNNCVSDSAEIVLSEVQAPQIDFPEAVSICDGEAALLDPGNFGPGVTYLWSNGSTDSTLLVSQPGPVSVTVSNGSCSSEGSITVGSSSTPSPLVISGSANVCTGSTLTLSVQPGNGVSVSWSGPNGFSANGSSISISDAEPGQAGLYIASQSSSGCPGIGDTASVSILDRPVTNLPSTLSVCDGTSAELDPIAAGAGFTYLWSTGSADSVISVSSSGLVTVTVSNQFCSVTDSVFVIESQTPSPAVISGPAQVCAGSDVQLTATVQTGTSLSWTGPNGFTANGSSISISNIQPDQAGLYILNQDLAGCFGTGDSITISVLSAPAPNLGDDITLCSGEPVLLDPGIDGPAFTYLWNTGSTDSSLTITTSGVYSVSVTLGICTVSDTISIQFSQPPAPAVISGPSIICAGNDVQLSASPVTTGVQYLWSGPSGFTAEGSSINLQNVQVLQSGSYILSQNLDGCPGIGDTITLTVNSAPVVDLGENISVCDGTPVLLDPVAGSSSGLTFIWSNGSTDSTLLVSAAGQVTVTVTNGTCSSSDSVSIQVSQTPPAISITGPAQACSGASVSFSTNPVAGVLVSWTGPNGFSSTGSSVTLSNLQTDQAGDYIAFQSLNGCEGKGDTISLSIFASPLVELGNPVSVCSGNAVLLDPVVGSAGLTFIWSNGSTDSSISVTAGGVYSVQVSNSICTIQDSVLVSVGQTPDAISISGSSDYCSGTTAQFASNPGTGVNVVWTGPNGFTSTDANISISGIQQNQAGLYILNQFRDGCPGPSDSILVSVLLSPQAQLGPDESVCDGNPVVLDPIFAGSGFTYLWNNGSTDSTISVSASGEFSVTVSNGNCQASDTVQILFGTTPAAVSITGADTICQGQNLVLNTDAAAETEVNWSGPGSFSFTGNTLVLNDIQLNQAGEYIAVPANNGCPGPADTIFITINASPQINLGPDLAVCNGSQITLDPIDGSQGLNFLWSNGSTDSSIVVSQAGTYTVTVTDGGVCPATDSIVVIDGVAPEAVPISGDTLYCVGSTAVFALPELNQITWSWTGPNGFTSTSDTITISNVTAANAGVYTVTPTIGNCPGESSSIKLVIGPDLVVNLGSDDTICGPGPVVLNPMNSAPGFTYQWSNGSTDSVILAVQSGLYAVTVRKQGCQKSDSVQLTFETLPATPTIVGNASYCSGSAIQLTLQNTESGVDYLWTGPNGISVTNDTLTITNSALVNSGDYQVTPVRNGCQGTASTISISIQQTPEANLGPDLQVCEGTPVTLDPGTGISGLTYLWNTGSSDSSIVVNSTGEYTVEVSNGSICVARDTINVQFNIQPGQPVISGDFQYCEGENAQFGTTAPVGVSVSWTGPNGFSFIGDQVNIAGVNVSQSGYYKAVLFSPGCLGTADSVLISVAGNPSVELGADTTTCSGTPVILSAPDAPGLTYLWTGGSTASQISVSGSGVYYLTVTNSGQCSATDSVTVTIKPSPGAVQIVTGSQTICSNETAVFKVQANENEQYNWQGPGGFAEVGDSVRVGSGISGAGSYEVRAEKDGCFGPATTLELILRTVPTLTYSFDSLVCKGRFKDATATASDGAEIFWSNLTTGPQTNLSVGKHWVTATLNGCSASDTFLIRNAGPEAAFITSPVDSLLEVFKDVNFLDQSKPGISPIASWSWDLGYATQSSLQNPVKQYDFQTPVDIILQVTDQAGCSDTLIKTIIIGAPRGWFIPNLFTPNGDDVNDKFAIRDLDKFPGTSLRIVNRWGRVEAEIDDYQNDWSGDGLQEGVYFYTIKRKDGQEFSGYVELKR